MDERSGPFFTPHIFQTGTPAEHHGPPHDFPQHFLPWFPEILRILAWFCSAADFRQMKETLYLQGFLGAPEEIRTPDPQIRSLVLYPAELRARFR
jgi:hypothetical protein